MEMRIVTIDAPSILGLRPTGVERLSDCLRATGFVERLDAEYIGLVRPPAYSDERNASTGIKNGDSIRAYSRTLATVVARTLATGDFPIILGGDCSILIGCALALRRRGRYGLFFLDGHADFYQPSASGTGEVADMDLAVVTGYGPSLIGDIENLAPYIAPGDAVLFGYRDERDTIRDKCQDIRATAINLYPFEDVRLMGALNASAKAVRTLVSRDIAGFWIHLDVDVLDDDIMPAVDYRMPLGLLAEELTNVLRVLIVSRKVVGMTITIFNPTLDPDRTFAKLLIDIIANGLR